MANNSSSMDQQDIGGYEAYVRQEDNHQALSVKVAGVNCAGCIQKIESALDKEDDVNHVRLNFTTGALTIQWNGDVMRANDFVTIVSKLGYRVFPLNYKKDQDEHEKHNRFLLMCLGVAGFAAGNIMLLSFGLWITDMETMGEGIRAFMHWISAVIAVPAIMFCGRPFFYSAWDALKNKRTNMDVPISLALMLATGMSIHELVRGAEHVYFDSALMLAFFLLIGRYLDFRARQNARSAALDLMSTLSGFATVIEGNKTRKIPISDVREGMQVQVAMGEKFPIDGTIIKGETSIDTSLVTGETMPKNATKGTEVYAGTFNMSATVIVDVAKAAEDSLLADIVRLMEKAEQGQAQYTRLADRAAKLYTPFVHTLALLAFLMWFLILGATWQTSLLVAVTVLIITCPCALGLAVPVAQVLATSRLMQQNIILKSGDALERLATIDTVCFDKTGTLTKGKPDLISHHNDDDMALACALASHSRHPLSLALINQYDGDLPQIDKVKEVSGKGLEATWNGQKIRLGSRAWCGDKTADAYMGPEIWLNVDGQDPVQFQFQDQLKSDAIDVVRSLQNSGLSCALLSGDRDQVVQDVAKTLSIQTAMGSMSPVEKSDYITAQQAKDHKVMMVGDGLNDAPVLIGANVSMAPGSAIDMAQNATDIVFMGDDLAPVSKTYRLALMSQRVIRENFGLAIAYNIIAVPIAFMGLVTPMIAAIAMSGSSLLVIANSFRLKWTSL